MASRFRKVVSTTVSAAMIYASWPASVSYAACAGATSGGSGPPSITATEVSTAQALQILRRRQDEQQQPTVLASLSQPPPAAAAAPPPKPKPVPVVEAPAPKKAPAAATKPAQPAVATPPPAAVAEKPAQSETKAAPPAPPAAATGEKAPAVAPKTTTLKEDLKPGRKMPPPADTVTKQAPRKPIVREAKPTPKEYYEPAPRAHAAAPSYGGSIKDDYVAPPSPTRGVWAQAYYDYERQGGWTLDGGTPGALTSRESTVGILAGADIIRQSMAHGGGQVVLGMLGGYSNTHTTYNNATFTDGDLYLRRGASDTTEGGSIGAYGLFLNDKLSADMLVKLDFMSYDKSDNTLDIEAGCGGDVAHRNASSDLFNVVLAGNVANRYMLSSNTWLEPTVGFRYTHSDYSNIKTALAGAGPALAFGLSDGDVLRLQGGVRYGFAHMLSADRVWIGTFGAFLYSDVLVSGISRDYQEVQEGKLRVMGQITNSITDRNGMTYMLQGEIRGGDDMIGVGVKGGVRYQW